MEYYIPFFLQRVAKVGMWSWLGVGRGICAGQDALLSIAAGFVLRRRRASGVAAALVVKCCQSLSMCRKCLLSIACLICDLGGSWVVGFVDGVSWVLICWLSSWVVGSWVRWLSVVCWLFVFSF